MKIDEQDLALREARRPYIPAPTVEERLSDLENYVHNVLAPTILNLRIEEL